MARRLTDAELEEARASILEWLPPEDRELFLSGALNHMTAGSDEPMLILREPDGSPGRDAPRDADGEGARADDLAPGATPQPEARRSRGASRKRVPTKQ
jgi:hypothetical protein